MKRIILALLAVAMVGAMLPAISAAKPTEFTFAVMSNEGGKSNLVGTVRLQSTGKGKTQIQVDATGLQPGAQYLLAWSPSTDCTGDGANIITSFTVKSNGSVNITRHAPVDATSISSVSLRANSDQTLVGCARTTP